jgi:NAD(P)-dependent dehydrogenase (short-subunit alcohol dehydrogenase family)
MANVLITGCSSGFGLLSALRFARNGDTVFATMRNTGKAGELERIRDAEKLPITVLQLDVLDDASVTRAVGEAIAAAGKIDVLVNNAGMELRGPIELADDDEIKAQFETNVFGTLRVIRAVVPAMRERGSGTVINVSSLAGVVVPPYGGFYAASKHALEAITEAMHYELSPCGIRVASIEPGAFPTNFRSSIVSARRFTKDSPYYERFERFQASLDKLTHPEGAPADPEDVAKAIYEAAYSESPRLRTIVGNDAKLISTVRKQTDFEGFEQAMRKTLDWWD